VEGKEGGCVSMKIKYVNQDRARKSIRLVSENEELVVVKNERLVLEANGVGEIRLRLRAPGNESREAGCRVDVRIDEWDQVEQSLYIRLRAV